MTPEEIQEKYLTGEFRLRSEFIKMMEDREVLTQNCEKYAAWTLPVHFPRDEVTNDDEFQADYQSLGGQLVTHLANKIMTALFPAGQPFFRNELSKEQRELLQTEGHMAPATIDATLAASERESMRKFAATNSRAELVDAIIQLIITGNCLIRFDAEKGVKKWTIRDYVINRDLEGTPQKMIIRETKALASLPDNMQAIVRESEGDHCDETKERELYTGIMRLDQKRYVVWQELDELAYAHKQLGIYTEDTLPWIPLVFSRCRDKDYGTGMVENYAGDFHSLSSFAEAILDFSALVTDVKNLVDPAGMTDVRTLTQAASGAYVPGREEDIFVHSPQVSNNAAFLETRFDSVARRLSAAFLMQSQVTRDAERVTAEEIRRTAYELESSLGGVYSRLANELQRPIAKRLSTAVDKVFAEAEPAIVTGLESLSRTSELDRIRAMMQDLIVLAEVPPEVADRLDYESLIKMLGAGHQVEYEKFLLDETTVKQKQADRAAQNAQAAGMEAQAVNQQG